MLLWAWFEYAILVALAAWSGASLLLLERVRPRGDAFSGADGIVAIDQLQYLAWIREASDSILVSNRFVVGGSEAVFLHPTFALSGLLVAAGLSLQLSLLIWKPVAVATLFCGFRSYVHRLTPATGPVSLAALTLGLFAYYPIQSLLERASLGTVDERFRAGILTLELFPAGLLWGYLPSAIAVGLMPVFLLTFERVVDPAPGERDRGRKWYVACSIAAGLITSWLHPWRGMVLLGILAAVVAWDRDRRRYLAGVLPALAVGAPLVYYAALSRLDSDWEHATLQNAILRPPWWGLLLALAPLLAIAAFGVRRPIRGFQERALIAWPLVTLGAYFVVPSLPAHVFAGVSLPLAILAVRAAQRLKPPPVLVAMAVGLAVVPGMVSYAGLLSDAPRARAAPHFLTTSERHALNHLAGTPGPGGVLPTPYLGMAVPGFGNRHSWLGNYLWTPSYRQRARLAEALFAGRLSPRAAQALARRSRARFVLADCRTAADLPRLLGDTVTSVRRFGCATVVELRPG